MTRPMPGPPTDLDCVCEWHDEIEPGAWEMIPWCPVHGDGYPEKRLTDAECEAEWDRAGESASTCHLLAALGDKRMTAWQLERQTNAAATWHRFATRPHALEENA